VTQTRTSARPDPEAPSGGSADWIGSVYLGRRADFIRRHRYTVSAIVLAISVATCLVLCACAGWSAVSDRLSHLAPAFILLTLAAHLVAYGGYLIAHHQVVNRSRRQPVTLRRDAQLVVIGFGGWLPGGGFTVDRRAVEASGESRHNANASAIMLGLLELLVLTPVAWLCALLLLHSHGIPGSFTVPWVVLVPIGFALALLALAYGPRRDTSDATWPVRAVGQLAAGTRSALALLLRPFHGAAVLTGIALYWGADLVALWASLHFVSTTIPLDRLILAYATGYILTRRTLPFAGTIIIEALLVLSLNGVGVPLASAGLAVLLYRLTDFGLTLGAALLVSSALEKTLTFIVGGSDG
jgi:hypothetical protein